MTRRSQPQYPPERRERAVRMVAEIQADDESPWSAMRAVAEKLGDRLGGDGAQVGPAIRTVRDRRR